MLPLVSAGLFVLSVLETCVYTKSAFGSIDGVPGFELLALGWVGVVFFFMAVVAHPLGVLGFILSGTLAWLANPLLWLSWGSFLVKKTRYAGSLAGAALLFMLSFLFMKTLPQGDSSAPIVGYGPGYWLWLGSAVLVLVGAFTLAET
jgi:hypothetical protein